MSGGKTGLSLTSGEVRIRPIHGVHTDLEGKYFPLGMESVSLVFTGESWGLYVKAVGAGFEMSDQADGDGEHCR